MKVIFVFLMFFCISCSHRIMPPVQTDVVRIESSLSYEQVWSKMIDFLAVKGTSIKILDKSSGLMTTDQYSLIGSYTFSDRKGNYEKPDAYVVLQQPKRHGVFNVRPDQIVGSWNVRIKQDGSNVVINVNLVNLIAYKVVTYDYRTYKLYFPVQSTGNFEKEIADLLK